MKRLTLLTIIALCLGSVVFAQAKHGWTIINANQFVTPGGQSDTKPDFVAGDWGVSGGVLSYPTYSSLDITYEGKEIWDATIDPTGHRVLIDSYGPAGDYYADIEMGAVEANGTNQDPLHIPSTSFLVGETSGGGGLIITDAGWGPVRIFANAWELSSESWNFTVSGDLTSIGPNRQLTVSGLSGSGNAQACVDSTGKLYRGSPGC